MVAPPFFLSRPYVPLDVRYARVYALVTMRHPKKKPATDAKGGTVSARLTADEIARVDAYSAALAARAKVRTGRSIAAAALIREGLAAVERAESAS